ncbi:hypothetical protein GUJ93_ZPchr0012g19264 [Zizania palustris]|uniref:Uncharacterized protein n=1 Tax=Zizania palustris TaxID=103762 RepID=A0A8J5WRV6_ZIZPA|nr:hypothetical protein GUJ93_ZPchr0012g19264 [Zizania palustris]
MGRKTQVRGEKKQGTQGEEDAGAGKEGKRGRLVVTQDCRSLALYGLHEELLKKRIQILLILVCCVESSILKGPSHKVQDKLAVLSVLLSLLLIRETTCSYCSITDFIPLDKNTVFYSSDL